MCLSRLGEIFEMFEIFKIFESTTQFKVRRSEYTLDDGQKDVLLMRANINNPTASKSV